jgi:hypothetical protein
MRLLIILAVAVALPGCGANWVGHVSTGGPAAVAPVAPIAPAAQGAAVVSGPQGLYASVSIGGAAANFLYWFTGAGIYAAMLADDFRHGGPFLPGMRADRTVVEVDCTRALPPDFVGNLRCK